MEYILSLDQGTTSSRAVLFDHAGEIISTGQYEFPQHFPHPGWIEHDANEIWESQWKAVQDCLKKGNIAPAQIKAIGITNQRETALLWDRRTGKPVTPAIVWQDRRTATFCEKHYDEWNDKIRAKTGLCLDPYFSGTKVKWLFEKKPSLVTLAQAGHLAFGTIETWLIWKLSEGSSHLTDYSNASRTMFFNIHTLEWDQELLSWLGIPPSILPQLVPNSEVVAHTSLLGPKIPIAGLAGDQQAALFGQLCLRKGMIKNTYGTGCFLLMQLGDKPQTSSKGLLTTIAWNIGGKTHYALEGSVFTGGSVINWLRDGLGIIEESHHIEALAQKENDNGGVYFIPALTGLGAPHWDPHARGSIYGITRGTNSSHLARASLESIAWQCEDLIKTMKEDTDICLRDIRVDGGASRSNLLLQIQSDFSQVTLTRPTIVESTARGAAFLAGLATGFWQSLEELESLWEVDQQFAPLKTPKEIAPERAHWNDAITRSYGWAKPPRD